MRDTLAGASMGPQQVEAIPDMSTGLREGFVAERQRDAATTTATTLDSWSDDILRPLLHTGQAIAQLIDPDTQPANADRVVDSCSDLIIAPQSGVASPSGSAGWRHGK